MQFFFGQIPRDAKILEVGCANGWAEKWARGRGWTDITGLDLVPPADIVGDIRDWKNLGLEAHSFDAVLAFEVVEHGDFAAPLHDLLRPDGRLMATTPVPHMDWLCQLGEAAELLQRRTQPAHASGRPPQVPAVHGGRAPGEGFRFPVGSSQAVLIGLPGSPRSLVQVRERGDIGMTFWYLVATMLAWMALSVELHPCRLARSGLD